MNKEELVLKSLIEGEVIPRSGLFQINEYHLKMYLEKEFLTHPDIYNESGEWSSVENSIEIFQRLISYIPS